MNIIKTLLLISVGLFFTNISCKKKEKTPEPKVENCIEAICIYKQTCSTINFPVIYFKLIDTTKFKGSLILDAPLDLLPNLNISDIKNTDRGFMGFYYNDGILDNFFEKAIVGRKYFFEFEIPKSRIEFESRNFKCQIMTMNWEQLILNDTLSTKCTKIK